MLTQLTESVVQQQFRAQCALLFTLSALSCPPEVSYIPALFPGTACPVIHTQQEDLHALVRVMQCFGSFGMGALGQAHVSGGRSTCELFAPRGESEPRGGLGWCAWGRCPGQIPRVPHQGAGQGVSKACLLLHTEPGSARVVAVCRICAPQDDQYYNFLAVTPSNYTVIKLH